MEKELESKIFMIEDYANKNNMEEYIKEYIKKLKTKYPQATITKEFYKGENILVRATEVYKNMNRKQGNKDKEKEVDDWYIRQRGGDK